MRYWWVNQNQTWRDEIGGGYLWSPKRKRNNAQNRFYDNMRAVAPGDVVFSFADKRIIAVGIIHSLAFESPKPKEFGRRGDSWNDIGWRVNVRYRPLTHQIRPADHMDQLRPALPAEYSPLSPDGNGYQHVYLASIPEIMAQILAMLVGHEAASIIRPTVMREAATIDFTGPLEIKEAWEETIVSSIRASPLPATEQEAIIRARRGQGQFRLGLMEIENHCRVSQVRNPEYLVASHIKPWRHGNDEERVDKENGLLLNPNVDLLFDRGLISFDDSGDLLVSPVADSLDLPRMGVELQRTVNVGRFTSGQRHYLEFHRKDIFLKVS